jgi:hypothetical protein
MYVLLIPLPKTSSFACGACKSHVVCGVQVQQEGEVHSLLIPEVFAEDAGIFTAKAENPAGDDTTSAKLTVEGKEHHSFHTPFILYKAAKC